MSEHLTQKGARPRERRRRRVIGWMFGLAVAIGGVVGVLGALDHATGAGFIRANPMLGSAILAVALPVLTVANLWYWRAIDELARQAHLEAWFWGGTGGVTAGVVCLGFAPWLPPAWTFGVLEGPASKALVCGGAAVLAAALIGYASAWVGFWLRRR